MKYLPLTAKIADVLDGELETLINKALTDMVIDTMSLFKNAKDPRKITIELSLVKFNDENIAVDFKVTPKAAPYTQVPEKQEKIADGQLSIYDELTGEMSEDDEEMESLSAEMEENQKRYELLVGKKRKRA